MEEKFINGRTLKEQETVRYEKLLQLQEKKYDVYGRKWERNFDSASLNETFGSKDKQELEVIAENVGENQIIIAGRLMTKRAMGKKAIFATLQDQNGQFQVYLNASILPQETIDFFNEYSDIGDFFGINGKVMRTNKGELTVKVYQIVMLSKAIRPLPDKWHGVKDIEERYRRRYVDLVMNEESKKVFIQRTQIINALREFLNNKGYLEVETPILQDICGGAAAKPFVTFHNSLDVNLYLRIATELHLKRLIVGGFEGVYEIGRLFRNEGMSPKHNPEFTTVEVYVAYQDMNFMMDLTENCIKFIINKIHNKLDLDYKVNNELGQEIDVNLNFANSWKKITMLDSIKEFAPKEFVNEFNEIDQIINTYNNSNDEKEINELKVKAYNLAKELAKKYHVKVEKHHNSTGHIINLFFEEFVEAKLIQPTFIYSYPVEISPLSKLSENSKEFTDRFELFIGGREYANAYSELNNPIQQYQRFEEQVKEKDNGNEEATSEIDIDYVEALEYGMPPTAGLGIGIDRLIMLITGQHSIKDVLLFPQLKPRAKN